MRILSSSVFKNKNDVFVAIASCACVCMHLGASRQALQELRAEAVRQQAEDEAWYTQQELLQQAEEQRRRILQEEENKLARQRTRSLFSLFFLIYFPLNWSELQFLFLSYVIESV